MALVTSLLLGCFGWFVIGAFCLGVVVVGLHGWTLKSETLNTNRRHAGSFLHASRILAGPGSGDALLHD
jgi:hypothetical protein